MAKALLGHTGVTFDLRLVAEVRALRTRVRDLETELERSRTENAVLAAALEVVDGTDTGLDGELGDHLDGDLATRRGGEAPVTLPEPAYT